jgi:hypothetical protein
MSESRSSYRKSISEWGDYDSILKLAETTDFSRIQKSGSVSVGKDLSGYPIITFFPTIGYDYGDNADETVNLIYLLFVKLAHNIITSGPFSIVYSRKSADWRKPLVYEYYKMLPEKEKKNLIKIFVINPQVGIRMFFAITRVFLSADFYKKLVFVENIAEFQRIVPPKKLILPYNYLSTEDQEKGLKCSGVSVPLSLDFVSSFGTTSIMKRCTKFLKDSGGLKRVGIFRVAGNENQLSLVRVRLQPPIYFTKKQMREYMNTIIVGLNDEDYRSNQRSVSSVKMSKKLNEIEDVSFHLSTVVITDIETVAQVFNIQII